MNVWLWLLPIIAATIGWVANSVLILVLFRPIVPVNFLGISIQGVLPKKRAAMTNKLAKLVNDDLFNLDKITDTITDPANLEKLNPIVEVHIDKFLKEKLATEMPMLSMFISEKTIGKLKSVFMDELYTMFPALMQEYAGNLKQQIDLEKMVQEKLSSFSNQSIEKLAYQSLQKEMRLLKLFGAVVGFLIGLAMLAITSLVS